MWTKAPQNYHEVTNFTGNWFILKLEQLSVFFK